MWSSILLVVLANIAVVICNPQNNDMYRAVPSAFLKDCLLEMNKYRKLHGAHPLRWSDDLQYHAQTQADKLASDQYLKNDLDVLDRLGQGETVSYLSPFKGMCRTYPPSGDCFACRETITTWYNESKRYNYQTGYSFDGKEQVLHFTQLVWQDTVKVGLATAVSPQYGLITVARYHPRGNIGFLDDYLRNVAPRGAEREDEFDGNGEEWGQGGPPCRERKRKTHKDCVNKYGDELCDFYAKTFPEYCEYNGAFMKKSCAKSCNICEVQFPAPPVESKDKKKLELRWQIGKWFACRSGFQWRSVKCYHKYKSHDYLVPSKFCRRELGATPTKYKDCLLLSN